VKTRHKRRQPEEGLIPVEGADAPTGSAASETGADVPSAMLVTTDRLGPYLAREWGVLADIDPEILELIEM